MKKFFFVLIAIIIVIGILTTIFSKKKESRNHPKGKVNFYVVKKGEITVKLEETGEIQPIKEIKIKSKVSGKILKFYVEEGDYVNQGDLLADIEPDYNQAKTISQVKSNLELAEIRLKNAKRDRDDKLKLYQNNFISELEYDSYEDALKEAEISYNAALQQYELVKEIETENNITKLVSTASGTVIQKLVEEGEMVVASTNSFSEGTVILKLADLNRMIVKSKINEVDISKIRKNQAVMIQVDAYPYEKYNGKITKIAAMAINSNNIKVFPIEVEIDNVDKKLKPGMTANITIIGEKKKDILVVPIRTIFSDEEGQDIVYKVSNDTISTSIPVKTGINNFQQVEIIEGLAEGDSISFTEPKKKKDIKVKFRRGM